MFFTVPHVIVDNFAKLNELIERNPLYIPIDEAAVFLGLTDACLRCAIDQGRTPFAFSWKNGARANRSFKIPTIAFYNWVTQGHATLFVDEYTQGKN